MFCFLFVPFFFWFLLKIRITYRRPPPQLTTRETVNDKKLKMGLKRRRDRREARAKKTLDVESTMIETAEGKCIYITVR